MARAGEPPGPGFLHGHGGTIPTQFVPAVEKGCRDLLDRGGLAGYRMQDVAVEVYFGKDHPVDSNENAFRTAGSMCFKQEFALAKPVLLEPIVKLEITVPGDKFGDITSDLNSRRGRVEGMDTAPGKTRGRKGKGHTP